jgi:hypothetical protein
MQIHSTQIAINHKIMHTKNTIINMFNKVKLGEHAASTQIQIQIQKYFILLSVEYIHFYTFKIRH